MHVSLHRRGGRRQGRPARVATAVLAVALTTTVTTASTSLVAAPAGAVATGTRAAATRVIKVRVGPRLFGVHDRHLVSLTRPGTGAIRLWDSGTTWAEMQPNPVQPINFSRLDQVVTEACAHGTEVTYVLGRTPLWAALPGSLGTDGTEPPILSTYAAFVRALMTRYRTWCSGAPGIAAYQVWNEANIATFWTGTPQQMADMVQAVAAARTAVSPSVKVVGPSMVTRLTYQQRAIKTMYAATTSDGHPWWRYVDALGFSLYPRDVVPTADGGTRPAGPEDVVTLLGTVRAILAADHVPSTIPLWDTEINYGLHSGATAGTPATPISSSRQVALVMRTYLLLAAQGVQRIDWYAYDMGLLTPQGGTIGNTLLTDPAQQGTAPLTPAGLAFERVQGWMHGTLIGTATRRPCTTDKLGTYTCVIRYAGGYGRVYWNPYRRATVALVPSAHRKVVAGGSRTKVSGGQKMRVGWSPVLVRSSR